MKNHPRLYVFVEGHCDKRGSGSYNFALGANRANGVRTALIQEGVSPDRVFTVSYGKEKLLFEEDGEEFHRLNRRSQFKVYEK
jgi:peptidoglycan-associated lipoprotein